MGKLSCFFGVHQYEVIREEKLEKEKPFLRALYVICQCKTCGTIYKKGIYEWVGGK